MKFFKSKKAKTNFIASTFILPNFIGFFIFTLAPVVAAMILSFTAWDGANPMTFVGLANFKKLLTDETFKISLYNTFYYVIGSVPLTIVCSLGLALLLNQPIKGKSAFRAIFFFPYVASLIAVAVVWNMIFHPDLGPVNMFLIKLGTTNPPRWTASVDWAMPTIILANIWKSMGYYMIVYLAALQGIPSQLYEAASIDGASVWEKFRYITIPSLAPATFFVSIMLTISSFKVFDLVFAMTGGGPGRATNVLVYHIYNTAFIEFKFGYSSAIAMVLFAIVLVITLIQFGIQNKQAD